MQYVISGIVSFIICITFVIISRYIYKHGIRSKRMLSSLQLLTVGVFLAVVVIFLPIYYYNYKFGDGYKFVRPFLISLHNALRVFILDGEFDIIVKSLKCQDIAVRVCFSIYAALLYVAAPILTFTNVLSLFKNVLGELRYKLYCRRKHYIMSELNEKSIALAKSIYQNDKKAAIVFTDVFEQNEENDYELLMKARDMNAICLKRDISYLNFAYKKGDIEIFLIGKDESENISQAVNITTELNKKNSKYNVKVFVFSTKPSAAYIIDSVKYGNLLKHASDHEYGDKCFKLRKIDEKQQLIWNTVPKMKLFELANRHEKTLSALIVGFGSYGIEFFKMLVWYCQFEGYKLQINIVDKRGKNNGEKNYIESLINRHCPELLKKNKSFVDGDSQYDIEIFSDVDALTSDIDELLLYGGNNEDKESIAKRIKSTNLAFVSLGDDDDNIEVSIHLRSLFDRINGVNAEKGIDWKDEAVDIYSVVYDDQKSSILYNENTEGSESHLLLNHKDVPYHIHFIGGMSSQFSYQNIYNAELEKGAYRHHRSWVDAEEKIFNDWEKKGDLENLKKHDWYFQGEKKPEADAEARKKYEQYEYYRLSSIAKELYCREIGSNEDLSSQTTCSETEKSQTCECDHCVRRKKNEHMRWNAYMRVIGFSYNKGKKIDRALLHNNLCNWGELTELDKLKD